jgi:hypothetical protein
MLSDVMNSPGSQSAEPSHTMESLVAWHAARNTDPMTSGRLARIARAIELGASRAALETLSEAARTSDSAEIVLPAHRYEGLSRGRGWARKGNGATVQWGDRVGGGYKVGPGRWVVGATDGFNRKDSTT